MVYFINFIKVMKYIPGLITSSSVTTMITPYPLPGYRRTAVCLDKPCPLLLIAFHSIRNKLSSVESRNQDNRKKLSISCVNISNIRVISLILLFLLATVPVYGQKDKLSPPLEIENNSLRSSLYYSHLVLPDSPEKTNREKISRQVTTAYTNAARDFSPAVVQKSLSAKIMFRIVRGIERGLLNPASLEFEFTEQISLSLIQSSGYRKPNKRQQQTISEAMEMVRAYCEKNNLPFTDISNTVYFYTPERGKTIVDGAAHSWIRRIGIPSSLNKKAQLLLIMHETFHQIFGGAPFDWLEEALVTWHSLQAYVEGTGVNLSRDPLKRISAWKRTRLITAHPGITKLHSPAGRFMVRELAGNGEIQLYLPLIALLENVMDNLVRPWGLGKKFIQAHAAGDVEFIIALFGENRLKELEDLDGVINNLLANVSDDEADASRIISDFNYIKTEVIRILAPLNNNGTSRIEAGI